MVMKLRLVCIVVTLILLLLLMGTANAAIFIRQPDGSYLPLKYSDISSVEANIYVNGVKVINTSTTLDDLENIKTVFGKNDIGQYAHGIWVVKGEHVEFKTTTTPTDYAQYRINISGTTWSIYNVTGALEASGTITDFWSKVSTTGSDIRVFDQNGNLMYFWIEEFDYTNQTAVIWVNLTTGSSELNIAYGNELATKSYYESGEQTFEFFDDFEGTELDTNKWTVSSGTPIVENGYLKFTSDAVIYTDTKGFGHVYKTKVRVPSFSSSTDGLFFHPITENIGATAPLRFSYAGDNYLYWYDGTHYTLGSHSNDGLWHEITIAASSDGVCTIYWDDSELAEYSESITANYLILSCDNDAGDEYYYDYVIVAKYADPADFGTPQLVSR